MTARVIGRSPTVWYSTVTIDKGSGAGVEANDPVVDGDGLVGRIADVTHGTAEVNLITDNRSAVSARVLPNGPEGVAEPEVGNSSSLLLDFIDRNQAIREGQLVVTAGWSNGAISSAFPPGIPIGEVSAASVERAGDLSTGSPGAVRRSAKPRPRPGGDRRPQATGGAQVIITRRSAIRIALIIVVAVVLQLSFFSYLTFFGTTPAIIPLVVISLGLLGGAVTGAVCGFAIGLLVDSALLQTLGISSLVLLGVGYLAGRYREGTEISNSLVPLLLIGALTTVAAAGFAAIQLMLGVRAPVSLLVLREIVVQGLLGGAPGDPALSPDPQDPAPGDRRRLRGAAGAEPDHEGGLPVATRSRPPRTAGGGGLDDVRRA